MSKALVEVCATEEVAAGAAYELAAAVFEAGGAGGAEDGMMLVGGQWAGGSGCDSGFGSWVVHFDSVAQFAIFSTTVGDIDASNDVRFAEQTIFEGERRWIAALAQCGTAA
jgi:hypothetical protein